MRKFEISTNNETSKDVGNFTEAIKRPQLKHSTSSPVKEKGKIATQKWQL